MSLAMFAAPFDDNNDSDMNHSENNVINKKKQAHNKTQKRYITENFDKNKVNSVLEKIHNNLNDDDDDADAFNPPPKTKSAGVDKTMSEPMSSMNVTSVNDSMFRTLGRAPQPNYENTDNLDLNDYTNYGDNKSNDEYYKRVIPGYSQQAVRNHVNKPHYTNANYNNNNNVQEFPSQDVLLQKLNYMISLLEDQQDERTNNVMEEVVLYSFLGIFVIFVADTFVRAGKYVR